MNMLKPASKARVSGADALPYVHPTVVHMLAQAGEQAGDRSALVCGGVTLTYSEYVRCVAAFATQLQNIARRGDRIAVVAGNSLDMAIALFAVHAAGCQVVPVNPAYTARELRHILSDSEPVAVIHDLDARSTVNEVARELEIQHIIAIGDGGQSLADVVAARNAIMPAFPQPAEFATLQYTGGTTGLSKGVNITHAQLSVNISQREAAWPSVPDDEIVLCVMPLFHVFASSMGLHLAPYCRGTLVIRARFHPEDALDAIETHRVTRLPVGATVFAVLMASPSFRTRNLASLRSAYSGAAALAEATLLRWQDATGCPILEGYGQSEGGPVLTCNYEGATGIPGSVGEPLPHTTIEIVDVETGQQTLAVGEVGEIRARGPQIMSGYRNRPEETAETLREGWLYTGDIGRLDEKGILYITDRKKDMAIVNGYNVYPREIDEVLFAHPDIREAASIGVPDARKGEVIHACVVLAKELADASSVLKEYCRSQLTYYKVPEKFHVVEALPKTAVGKIDRVALRRTYAEVAKGS